MYQERLPADSPREEPTLDRSSRILLQRLENCELSPGEFTHRDHVRATWAMLREDGLASSLGRLREVLQRFAQRAGAPEHYHETVTVFFFYLIRERVMELPPEHRWTEFEAANGDLLEDSKGLLARHYSSPRLNSITARRAFLLPDRAGATARNAWP